MAISVRCLKCRTDTGVKQKNCPKCGATLRESKVYRVRMKLPDGQWKSVQCVTLSQAKEVEAKIKSDIVDGRFNRLKRAPKFKIVFARYVAWAKSHKTTWADDETRYRLHIEPVLGELELNKITALDVERALDGMRAKETRLGGPFAPATLRQVLVLIKRVFNWARDMGLYPGDNPVERVKLPSFDNRRINPLAEADQEKLMETISGLKNVRARLVIQFALATGRRRQEILTLRWEDVDFDRKQVKILATNIKTRKTQHFPLNEMALAVLKEAKAIQVSELCFPASTGKHYHSFDKTWEGIRKKAGLPDCRLHDLRHTFASNLINAGVTLYHVQNLLGHQSSQMTQRYAHLSDAETRNAVEKIGQHRRELREIWESLASKRPLPAHLDRELQALDAEHAALVARLGGDGQDNPESGPSENEIGGEKH